MTVFVKFCWYTIHTCSPFGGSNII